MQHEANDITIVDSNAGGKSSYNNTLDQIEPASFYGKPPVPDMKKNLDSRNIKSIASTSAAGNRYGPAPGIPSRPNRTLRSQTNDSKHMRNSQNTMNKTMQGPLPVKTRNMPVN